MISSRIFRGRRLGGGEWVKGGISPAYHSAGDPMALEEKQGYSIIQDGRAYAVYQDTIGQCTGLSYFDGAPIFEDDLVEVITPNDRTLRGRVRFGMHAANASQKCVSVGFWIEWAAEDFWRSELGFWRDRLRLVCPWADDPQKWDAWCMEAAGALKARRTM